ncbi:hypothetical protein PtrEW13061_012272, partial [Pyrenophora tritici-repentis]
MEAELLLFDRCASPRPSTPVTGATMHAVWYSAIRKTITIPESGFRRHWDHSPQQSIKWVLE